MSELDGCATCNRAFNFCVCGTSEAASPAVEGTMTGTLMWAVEICEQNKSRWIQLETADVRLLLDSSRKLAEANAEIERLKANAKEMAEDYAVDVDDLIERAEKAEAKLSRLRGETK